MSVKSILTVVKDPGADAQALEASVAMASARDAHLKVLCLGLDRTHPGVYYAGANAMALKHNLDQAKDEAQEAETAVRTRLKAEMIAWEAAPAVAQLETVAALVAQESRYADLVMLPRPYGEDRGAEDVAVAEAALFGGRAPVLVVPPAQTMNVSPRNVLVAWDESAEALVAARRALPFLQQADRVTVTLVDPPAHGPERSDPGGPLCQMLVRHGVKTEVSVLARTMPRVSDVLIRAARDTEADMIVMGAYGHSRFRESILGGATRHMLEQADLPVLMAH